MAIRILILAFTFFSLVAGQTTETLTKKNVELDEIRNSIQSLEKDLSEIKNQKESSVTILKKIDQENLLISKAINNLKYQEQIKSNQISRYDDSINVLNNKASTLQNDYSDYVRWLFKYSRQSALERIFTSASFNEALMRYKYYNLITSRSETKLNNLISIKTELTSLREKLQKEVEYKNQVIAQKNEQLDKLEKRKNEKTGLLNELRKDEKNLESEIDEKRKAEIVIKNLITRLEEEERERERKLREEKLKGETPTETVPAFNYSSFADFAELRGKMNWPVNKGSILRTFGENKNERLNTVTLNYGIDIKTEKNATVHSVAEGVVSVIDWIPGYGSVVIITHKGKYRTVYGHVADITVNENQKVNAGDMIGKVNQSLEGNIIHFEVWNERNYQNPEVWLVKK